MPILVSVIVGTVAVLMTFRLTPIALSRRVRLRLWSVVCLIAAIIGYAIQYNLILELVALYLAIWYIEWHGDRSLFLIRQALGAARSIPGSIAARKWPLQPAPTIAILGSHRHGLDRANEIASDISKSVAIKAQQRPVFVDQAFLRTLSDDDLDWLAPRLDGLLIANYRFLARQSENERLFRALAGGSRGKIWILDFFLHETQTLSWGTSWSDPAFDSYGPMSVTFVGNRRKALADLSAHITRIVDDYMTSTVPMHSSDSLLPTHFHELSCEIKRRALYPIAASYQRLRHATSDSERLLCVFELVEIFMVLSAVVGLVQRWRAGDTGLLTRVFPKSRKAQFENFTLGDWKHLLESVIEAPGDDGISGYLQMFWNEKLTSAPALLIDQVHGSGLILNEPIPRSHQGWLTWFVSLRNSTRGHGVVTDAFARPLWHGFHETILAMTRALSVLTMESPLLVFDGSAFRQIRAGFDISYRGPAAGSDGRQPVFIELPREAGRFSLFPFLALSGERLVMLQKANDKSSWYIDYATGRILKFSRLGRSIFDEWASSGRVERGVSPSIGLSTNAYPSTEKPESSGG